MEDRLLVVAAVALAGLVIYLSIKLAHRLRISGRGLALPEGWREGSPGVLYFSSRTCTPCLAQGKAVDRLRDPEGALNLVKVDVDGEPGLAEKWSVLTVPTTVVLDSGGRIQTINHGAASEKKLRRQLEGVL